MGVIMLNGVKYSGDGGSNSGLNAGFSFDEEKKSVALGNSLYGASGEYSAVVGGDQNNASGEYSIVLGGAESNTFAKYSAVLGGYRCYAQNISCAVVGQQNANRENGGNVASQKGDAFIVGNGTSQYNQSNAFRVTFMGETYGTRAFQSSGADYAEYFERSEGFDEDWVGFFITMKNGYVYKAKEGDYILGIVSGNPSVIGNADEDYYWRYERDKFNRIVMEEVPEMVQMKDEQGNLMFDRETHEPIMIETGNFIPNARMKLSEGYNPSLQNSYVSRKDRNEWVCVGMLGVLPVRDDGTCLPGHYCKCGQGGIATIAEERGFDTYMVIERISDNIVSVILK